MAVDHTQTSDRDTSGARARRRGTKKPGSAPEPTPGQPAAFGASQQVTSPSRQRRRPLLAGLGVALIVIAALAGAFLVQTLGGTTPVIAVARDVPAGAVLQAEDLRVVDVRADGLATVPGDEMSTTVGQRAVVSLQAGQTLTRSAVAPDLSIGVGQALVGVSLTAAQMPSEPLRGGDEILVVDTPAAQADPPTTSPASIDAIVVSTTPVPDTGQVIVNVRVAKEKAAGLAARVATGRIGIVVLPPDATPTPTGSGTDDGAGEDG